MHATSNLIPTKSHFTLKGSLFTLTTLVLESDDLAGIEDQLIQTIKQAPKFFDQTPLVLDFKKMGDAISFDLLSLVGLLRQYKLIPVGIRGGSNEWHKTASEHGLAILAEDRKSTDNIPTATPTPQATVVEAPAAQIIRGGSKLVTTPVRSGQQIYAQGGDLIVLAPVSVGAELLADGHIHVYSALRGRALAGVLGDTSARIFCSSLEAELISIAGQYKVSEQLKELHWKSAVSIELYEGNLKIQAM